jgi:hypothetical protein
MKKFLIGAVCAALLSVSPIATATAEMQSFPGCDRQQHSIPRPSNFNQCMANGPRLNCSTERTRQHCLNRFPIAGSCPSGTITCAAWCSKHPERTTCMTGHPNSCDKKPRGAATCVPNSG